MKSLKTVCLAAGAAMLVANARAGEPGKMYLDLDAGPAFLQDVTIKSGPGAGSTLTFDTGVRADAGFGYNVTDALSVELESGVVWNSGKNVSGDVYQIPVLFEGIWNIPVNGAWSAYIGGGVGGVWTDVESGGTSNSDFVFAFSGVAGLKYKLSDKADVGIAYKFLGSLDHNFGGSNTDPGYTHSVLASLNWKF